MINCQRLVKEKGKMTTTMVEREREREMRKR